MTKQTKPTTPEYVSDCCGARWEWVDVPEFDGYKNHTMRVPICDKCGNPCTPIDEIWINEIRQLWNHLGYKILFAVLKIDKQEKGESNE